MVIRENAWRTYDDACDGCGCGCGCERTTHRITTQRTHARTRARAHTPRTFEYTTYDSTNYYTMTLSVSLARSRSWRARSPSLYAPTVALTSHPAAALTPAPPPPRSAAPAPSSAPPRTHRAAPRAAAPTPGRQSCTTTSPPARGASRGRTTRRRWTSNDSLCR